ncbi:MAG: Ycf66 family protein [Oscillatoria sp. PMC 1068.18]|nr:Ycf66 family protein [Oscillatoria sp. PMC 1076.18]MEC4990806.1 Ycf66 family protein [Oscillatoria sp. PMC 1068.18]
MLAYILAIAVALGSFGFYFTAFFFPELHRKSDFIWSGVGLFYALVLWVCAGRITGGVLLGQMAGVALLGWFGWQTLTLRKELTTPAEQTEISPDVQENLQTSPVGGFLKPITRFWGKKKPKAETTTATLITETTPEVTRDTTTPTEETNDTTTVTQEISETTTKESLRYPQVEIINKDLSTEETEETEKSETPEIVAPKPPPAEVVEAAKAEATTKTTDVESEEIAPEVELAPKAEPPGVGDPQMRQTPPEITTESETEPKPENPA